MLLKLKSLNVHYGRIRAVTDLNMEVAQGEIVAILGSNGAGKSSLLRAILGVERVRSGELWFDESDILSWSTPKRVAAGLVLVPEGRRILINQTIHENLLLGATARQDDTSLAEDIAEVLPTLSQPTCKALYGRIMFIRRGTANACDWACVIGKNRAC